MSGVVWVLAFCAFTGVMKSDCQVVPMRSFEECAAAAATARFDPGSNGSVICRPESDDDRHTRAFWAEIRSRK